MLSKIRQRSWEVGQSLAGDGMLLRLRNASIALVGAVAAVGLGLTLFISQLGFPAVFSSPIPGAPTETGRVHSAIALTQGPGAGALSASSSAPSSANVSGPFRQAGQTSQGSGGTVAGGGGDKRGSRQTAVSPGAQSSPAASQPSAPTPVSVPTAQTVQPPSSPAPVPAVVESPAQPSVGGQSKAIADAKAKPSAPSTAKVTSDSSAKSETAPPGKDKEVGKSDGKTTSVAKSNSTPAEKASKDQSAAAAPKPVASVPAPEAANPAADKEAADSGKSGWSR